MTEILLSLAEGADECRNIAMSLRRRQTKLEVSLTQSGVDIMTVNNDTGAYEHKESTFSRNGALFTGDRDYELFRPTLAPGGFRLYRAWSHDV